MHHTHSHSHSDEEAVAATPDSGLHTHADGTTHRHDSAHQHTHGHSHSHRRGSLWMGMLHGAAGTAAFAGEALVAVSQSYAAVFLYTLFFSIGVLGAMAVYAGTLGGLIDWGGRRFRLAALGAQALAGIAACAVGGCWVLGIPIPWIAFH